MTRDDYKNAWLAAADSGTLLTSKHDPANLSVPYHKRRSVTCMSALDLASFIKSGEYSIRIYENNNTNHPPHYREIIPTASSIVAGSGIPPHSTTPTVTNDRFVLVSGTIQGWHIHTESSANIRAKEAAGDLALQIEYL